MRSRINATTFRFGMFRFEWPMAVLTIVSFAGCSLCPAPYDYDYTGFGSRTPRTDMRNGRVGSIFSDPAIVGSRVVTSSQSSSEAMEEYYDSMPEEILDGAVLDLGDSVEGIEIVDPPR